MEAGEAAMSRDAAISNNALETEPFLFFTLLKACSSHLWMNFKQSLNRVSVETWHIELVLSVI